MLNSKIENKIKLLEEKLQEIDTSISDPIERNERKIELQKQIKKLTRTKNNFEKLQQEQHELESLKTDFLITHEQETNKQQDSQHLQEQNSAAEKIKSEVEQDNINNQVTNNWDLPVNKSSEDWTNDSHTLVSDGSNFLENSRELPKNVNNPQTTHLIYLSKRTIWISSIFALFGFIFPYIYTRRWKPLCILFTAMVSAAIFISDESTLVAAPWISAIDNGIAISKSKSKVKLKIV